MITVKIFDVMCDSLAGSSTNVIFKGKSVHEI
jgi:hypothetical protein